MVSYEPKIAEAKTRHYAYDPHLSPQLVWAGKPGLKSIEVEDAAGIDLDSVALHVHERVSTKAIINAVKRGDKQHTYLPDFLVKLKNGATLILEIKGFEDEQDRAKSEAAKRWCYARTRRN